MQNHTALLTKLLVNISEVPDIFLNRQQDREHWMFAYVDKLNFVSTKIFDLAVAISNCRKIQLFMVAFRHWQHLGKFMEKIMVLVQSRIKSAVT